MPPEIAKYLQDVRQACELLTSFTAGKGFANYVSDALLRAGVEREFIIIGEALSQADKLDAAVSGQISEFRRIVGFRNILVHGYAHIVWGVLEKDLPALRKEVEAAGFAPP